MNAETPYAPVRSREIPACRRSVDRLGRTIEDSRPGARVERDRRKAELLTGLPVDETGSTLRTMVKPAAVCTLEVDPVDHAGLQVGNKKLVVPLIERDIAKRRSAVGSSVERDCGK